MKVFISGSKSIAPYCENGQLPERVLTEINKLVDANDVIFVGDCSGTDTFVQEYLESIHYRNVKIYVSGVQDRARLNAGKWDEKHVQPAVKNGFRFYLEKDLHMAEDADAGFAIWDGNSKGTYFNMVCLVAQGKPCHVFLLKEQKWIAVKSLNELETYAVISLKTAYLKEDALAYAKDFEEELMTWDLLKIHLRLLAGNAEMREVNG